MAGDVYEVDIATRVVEDDEDFYIVRPGKGFTLYRDFDERSAAFLDFPNLDLAAFQAAQIPTLRREMVMRSLAIRDWHMAGRELDEPSRDLRDYNGKATRRRLGHYVAAIEKLYFQLGDETLIIVPGQGPYSDVLIGVLDGATADYSDFSLYPNETLSGRHVRWLARRRKSLFSEPLRERLGNPHPVMQLDRSLREEVLRVAYDQFVIDDVFTARFRTEADDYSSLDDEDITSFANYIAAMIAAFEEEGNSKKLDRDEAMAILRTMRDRVPELSTNISSPGFLRLLSKRVDPLTIATFMAIALAGATPSTAAGIDVINSAGPKHDGCALVVSQQAKGAMSIMAFDDWQKQCKRLHDAGKSVHLQTSMKVKHKRMKNEAK